MLMAAAMAAGGSGPPDVSSIQYVGQTSFGIPYTSPSKNLYLPNDIPGLQHGDVVFILFASDSLYGHNVTFDSGSQNQDTFDEIESGLSSPNYWIKCYQYDSAKPRLNIDLDGATQAYHGAAFIIFAFRNVQYPLPVAAVEDTSSAGMPHSPQIDNVYSSSFVLLMGFLDDDRETGASLPGAFMIGGSSVAHGSSVNNASVMAAYYRHDQHSGGTITPPAFAGSSSDSWYAVTLELWTT
jgi:hypothetical protein